MINATIICDGEGCSESAELDGCLDHDIEKAGFHLHPECGYTHYCSTCWPEAAKRIEEEIRLGDASFECERRGC